MNDDKIVDNKFDKNTHQLCRSKLLELLNKFKNLNNLSRSMRIADKSLKNVIDFKSRQRSKMLKVFLTEDKYIKIKNRILKFWTQEIGIQKINALKENAKKKVRLQIH